MQTPSSIHVGVKSVRSIKEKYPCGFSTSTYEAKQGIRLENTNLEKIMVSKTQISVKEGEINKDK